MNASLLLSLGVLMHQCSGFDLFSSFFKKNDNVVKESRDSRHSESEYEQSSQDSWYAANEEQDIKDCKGYLCDFKVGPCVDSPLRCPCPMSRKKCLIGKDHYVCIRKDESCRRLQKQ